MQHTTEAGFFPEPDWTLASHVSSVTYSIQDKHRNKRFPVFPMSFNCFSTCAEFTFTLEIYVRSEICLFSEEF